MERIKIGSKYIGTNDPTYIIAEMSGNHGGSLETALQIVRAAANSGADAIKLQTYTADTITLNSNKEDFQLPGESPWSASRTYYQLYKEAFTPWEWHKILFAEAKKLGIDIFSSPFDETAVDLLEDLGACAYKIASPEVTHIPLLKKVAATKKPVIFSTGVAELPDIELAVKTLRDNGCKDIIILKCTTAYPADPELLNLRTIQNIEQEFKVIPGFSDHSLGIAASIVAVALGAKVIEKHFTLTSEDKSVDSFFSLETEQFSKMIQEIRFTEKSLGVVQYELDEHGKKSAQGRRSLYISANIQSGELISEKNIKCVRPSFGLHPKHWDEVIGRKVRRNLEVGDRLRLEDLE